MAKPETKPTIYTVLEETSNEINAQIEAESWADHVGKEIKNKRITAVVSFLNTFHNNIKNDPDTGIWVKNVISTYGKNRTFANEIFSIRGIVLLRQKTSLEPPILMLTEQGLGLCVRIPNDRHRSLDKFNIVFDSTTPDEWARAGSCDCTGGVFDDPRTYHPFTAKSLEAKFVARLDEVARGQE